MCMWTLPGCSRTVVSFLAILALKNKNTDKYYNITCQSPIEAPYYSSDIGRADLCSYCGGDGAQVDPELKKSYKTVFPICPTCTQQGHTPCCMRLYGNKKQLLSQFRSSFRFYLFFDPLKNITEAEEILP